MTEKPAHPPNREASRKIEFATTGFKRFIQEMYPKVKQTKIPDFVMQLTNDLESNLEKNPMRRNRFEAERSHLVVGRSSIKRSIFGTPPGYWFVSDFFQYPVLEPDLSTAMRETLEKARNGPNDIDLIYSPKAGGGVKDVMTTAMLSLESQGFIIEEQTETQLKLVKVGQRIRKPYDDYHATIKYLQIGEPNNIPVEIINIYFSQFGSQLLKVDLVKAPTEDELDNNFRLTGANSNLDLASLGYLYKTRDGKSLLNYETLAENVLDAPELIRHHYQRDSGVFINSWYSRIRTMLQRTLWFNNFKLNKDADYGDYSLPNILNQINRAQLDKTRISSEEWLTRLQNPQQLNKLKSRLPDILTDFLVGLSYDPFLFTKLIYEAGLMTYLPIGQEIKKPGDLLNLIAIMAEDFGHSYLDQYTAKSYKELFLQDPTNTLPLLSREYQQRVLNHSTHSFRWSGSFLLTKALNKLIVERGSQPLPESLASFEELFSPVKFYENHSTPAQTGLQQLVF